MSAPVVARRPRHLIAPLPCLASSCPELVIDRAGYPLDEHFVETVDGYVLGVYRIPHGGVDTTVSRSSVAGPRPVVLLQHGLLESSATWVLNRRGVAKRVSPTLPSISFCSSPADQCAWLHVFLPSGPTNRWASCWLTPASTSGCQIAAAMWGWGMKVLQRACCICLELSWLFSDATVSSVLLTSPCRLSAAITQEWNQSLSRSGTLALMRWLLLTCLRWWSMCCMRQTPCSSLM